MAHPIWSATQTILQTLLIIYAIFVFGFYILSDSVIFQPPRPTYQDKANIIKIPLENGNKISALYLTHPHATITLLYSHGNAEDLGTLYPLLEMFQQHGYNVLAYDYQGYGTSDGKPSEKNTYQDIMAAYTYLTQTLAVPASHIVVYGRSVGTGPSVYLATKVPVKALILESPFVSAYRVQTTLPLIPFDKYPNLARISQLDMPLLVIHGTKDTVIPFWHGKMISEKALGPTQTYWVDGANHNDAHQMKPTYWKALSSFIESLSQHKQNNHE